MWQRKVWKVYEFYATARTEFRTASTVTIQMKIQQNAIKSNFSF